MASVDEHEADVDQWGRDDDVPGSWITQVIGLVSVFVAMSLFALTVLSILAGLVLLALWVVTLMVPVA